MAPSQCAVGHNLVPYHHCGRSISQQGHGTVLVFGYSVSHLFGDWSFDLVYCSTAAVVGVDCKGSFAVVDCSVYLPVSVEAVVGVDCRGSCAVVDCSVYLPVSVVAGVSASFDNSRSLG